MHKMFFLSHTQVGMKIRGIVLVPVVLLVLYIVFIGVWIQSKTTISQIPQIPHETVLPPVQTYSPEYRQASRCYDCECPYRMGRSHLYLSHGQPKMTPGF
jgi:hypothetical protein